MDIRLKRFILSLAACLSIGCTESKDTFVITCEGVSTVTVISTSSVQPQSISFRFENKSIRRSEKELKPCQTWDNDTIFCSGTDSNGRKDDYYLIDLDRHTGQILSIRGDSYSFSGRCTRSTTAKF